MANYTSKRAQHQHAQSLDDALSEISSDMGSFADYISVLENRLITGKTNDSYSYKSTQELLAECKSAKSDVRTSITKLKGIDPQNSSISEYESQYRDLSQALTKISKQIGDLPLKKTAKKHKLGEDDDDDNEPSASDLQKQYIASLHFSIKDANKLTTQLGQLSNKIMTEFLKFSLIGSNYKLARSKFKEGLLILKNIEPDNPMIPVYNEQINDWNKKHKSNIIKRFGILTGILIFFSICMILDNK